MVTGWRRQFEQKKWESKRRYACVLSLTLSVIFFLHTWHTSRVVWGGRRRAATVRVGNMYIHLASSQEDEIWSNCLQIYVQHSFTGLPHICWLVCIHTVLSQASAHGRSQLKHQKLRVGGYTKEMLECSNYLRTSAHPSRMQTWLPGGTESTCIVALPVLRRGHPDGGKCCIVLESRPTHSLVAKLPQHLSLAVHELCAAN